MSFRSSPGRRPRVIDRTKRAAFPAQFAQDMANPVNAGTSSSSALVNVLARLAVLRAPRRVAVRRSCRCQPRDVTEGLSAAVQDSTDDDTLVRRTRTDVLVRQLSAPSGPTHFRVLLASEEPVLFDHGLLS